MKFLSKVKITLGLLLAVATFSCAKKKDATSPANIDAKLQLNSSSLQFLSFASRDQPPSVDEANSLALEKKTLTGLLSEWLASPEHSSRIRRYFNDIFGVNNQIFLIDGEFILKKNALGIYKLPDKSNCDLSTAVQDDAWWLAAGEKVLICPTSRSAQITYASNSIKCPHLGSNGILNASCGCGPKQILCYPSELEVNLIQEVRTEFAERGLYAYQQNLTWADLFGGSFFYGSRLLYHYYLFSQQILPYSTLPSAGDMNTLLSLPISDRARAPFPAGPERAGVVTSPGFMKQFNNFRSRIRGLTNALLCQDMDPNLNTDNIQTLINPDLSAADKVHGTQVGCSGCHYAMDNMGSTLLNWDDNGIYQSWLQASQSGHAFGVTGTGPGFLMEKFIERGPGFEACMAKKAWEEFSGESWDSLNPDTAKQFQSFASSGPGALLRGILNSQTFINLRKPGAKQLPVFH